MTALVAAELPGLVPVGDWSDVIGVGAMCDEIEDAIPGSALARFLRGSIADKSATHISKARRAEMASK